MQNYLDLVNHTLLRGRREANRTGVDALVGRPAMLEFDLADGFPAVTTKKLAFGACVGEFIAFMQAKTNAQDFADLGCNFWFQNANENAAWLANPNRKPGDNDLGRIYGAQWRDWRWGEQADGYYYTEDTLDQVINALHAIRTNPTDRGILISGWRPDQFELMALRPCHVLYQFMVDTSRRELSLSMYMRSTDLFLGLPMNIGSCALMLSLFAAMTGLRPRHVTIFMAIPHLYTNHVDQARIQLDRTPGKLPQLGLRVPLLGMASDAAILDALTPDCFWLENYQACAAIKAPMAV